MRPFLYERAPDRTAAVKIAQLNLSSRDPQTDGAQYLAGGTTLLDLMKLDVMRPQVLIDVGRLGGELTAITTTPDGIRVGALVRMSEAAESPILRREAPVLVQTLELAASQQLRNMASLGGNVLQRTRCPYFRDTSWSQCNKRNPGSGCAAREGFNRMHAVLGTSEHCIATYAGDFAQALIALDATVEAYGPKGIRTIPFAQLHLLPAATPHIETTLLPGELITAFEFKTSPLARRSLYRKVRDRESYEFALASAAVAMELNGSEVRAVHIALGGVATAPWRAREAEAVLTSRTLNEQTARAAALAAYKSAQPLRHNGFKIELGRSTLVRALLDAQALEV